MIIPEVASNCFQTPSQGIQPQPPYTDVMETSSGGGGCGGGGSSSGGGSDTQLGSLLRSLSMLKEKVNQVQSLAALFISSGNHQGQPALARMGTLIQEIIVTASSMMFNCQQMALGSTQSNDDDNNNNNNNDQHQHQQQMLVGDGLSQLSMVGSGGGSNSNNSAFFYGESFYNWYTDNTVCNNNNNNNNNNEVSAKAYSCGTTTATTTTTTTTILDGMCSQIRPRKNTTATTTNNNNNVPADQPHPELEYDIVELDAANLLAKYTHYCQVCGKGFKRDANLRMHMRAHGDEYKSSAALSNPLKHINGDDKGESSSNKPPRKYSCPQEGCRWNKKHAKFQPLKSMICVKNHYKRSHCPKMYVCKRCNRKQFSVLSDLRTHEKHCGDLKWQCSCGTTFSRKDKLMGHVALFVGHTPIINPSFGNSNKIDCQQQGLQIQFEAHSR